MDNSASEVESRELEDRTRENGVGCHYERLDASVGRNHSGENEHSDDNVHWKLLLEMEDQHNNNKLGTVIFGYSNTLRDW